MRILWLSSCRFVPALAALAALLGGCGRHDTNSVKVNVSNVRADLLEGAVTLPLDNIPAPAGAVQAGFRSIDWEIAGGLVLLSWCWEGAPRTFVVYCGDELVSKAEGTSAQAFVHALWQEPDLSGINKGVYRSPGIYYYRVVAEAAGVEPREITCGPVIVGRILWEFGSSVREACSNYAVYLRRRGEVRAPLCIYTAAIPEAPAQAGSVALKRIFSDDDTVTRAPGERQFLFGETRSAAVTTRVNEMLFRAPDWPVNDDEVWAYLLSGVNTVTLTHCNVDDEGAPDRSFESAPSGEVQFTYQRITLSSEE